MRDPVVTDEFYHGQAVDAETAREIFLEKLREEIKNDPDSGPNSEKARLALEYAEAYHDEFLKWAAERVLDELTPAFDNGWEERSERI